MLSSFGGTMDAQGEHVFRFGDGPGRCHRTETTGDEPAEEGKPMQSQPWEMEVNARYARERVATVVAATRPVAPAPQRRSDASAMVLGHVRQLVGRRLIAIGQRLVGPVPSRPAAKPVA